MDIEWAERKLVQYLELCDGIRRAVPPGEYWNDRARALNEDAELMIATVQRILREIDPADLEPLQTPNMASADGEGRVRRALGALRDRAEVDERLAPEGPELAADQLHPIVWRSAAVLWNTGEYRVAAGQAALALATQIKARARSKLTDRKLMQDVFAAEPPKPGSTRLQLPGDRDDDTWKSRQQGLHLLAQGAYAGIRNVSAHEAEPWSEQLALEYLAVLSVVARWAAETELVTG